MIAEDAGQGGVDEIKLAEPHGPALPGRNPLFDGPVLTPNRDRFEKRADRVQEIHRSGIGGEQLANEPADHALHLFYRHAGLEQADHLAEQLGLPVAVLQFGHVIRQVLVRLLQFALYLLALPDIPQEQAIDEILFSSVGNAVDPGLHRYPNAVLPDAFRFAELGLVRAAQFSQDRGVALPHLGRDQLSPVGCPQFLGSVSGQHEKGRVVRPYASIDIGRTERLGGGFEGSG